MKATGIVRRVDDLGRIVIPKEIRRTLRIREGDPLEIYTEKDGGVIFRKYSPMGDLQEFAAQMCESIGSATGHIAAVTDRDSIIALYGIPKRELMDKPNSPELEKLMEQRKNYLYKNGDAPILAADGEEKYHLGAAAPILSQGDLMGCVLLLPAGLSLLQNPRTIDPFKRQSSAGSGSGTGQDRCRFFGKTDGELAMISARTRKTFWLLFAVQKHSKIKNAAYSRRLRHSVWQGKEGWLWRMSICPTSSV